MSEAAVPAERESRFRLSLKLKLSLLIASLLVLTVSLVSTVLLREQQSTLKAEMTKRGVTIARNLAAGAKNGLLTEDELTLTLLVKDAVKDADVAYVVITDETGKALAHSDTGQVGKPVVRPPGLKRLGREMLVQNYDAERGGVIDIAVPLTFRNVTVGALYLGFSQRSIEATARGVRFNTFWISVAMVMVGVAGAAALAAFLSRPIRRLMEGTRAIAAGDFTVALAIPSRDEIGALTSAFNAMARSLHEKEMIKHAFTRYVPREVVDEILKDPERIVLRGERREVTVLFCDIRGFTATAEKLSPEEVVALLNTFYTLMIDTTFKHDGTLDKFLGDGVMAIFGAPIYREDHALLAVRTAVAMQNAVRTLSELRVREGLSPIAVGIGVNAGQAVAGTVGTEDRMEYTVIGDSVNLAARLQSTAHPGQILITQQTYLRVKRSVKARSLGHIEIKGKEDEVGVYEVLGVTP